MKSPNTYCNYQLNWNMERIEQVTLLNIWRQYFLPDSYKRVSLFELVALLFMKKQ